MTNRLQGIVDLPSTERLDEMQMSAEPIITERERIKERLAADRWAAHEIIFARRHEYPSAPYHQELVADFWSDEPETVVLGFRGAGKTTTDEEDITLAAVEGAYKNILLIGSNETRSAEPLASIKNEIDTNDLLREVYGDMHGPVWGAYRIVLKNGTCIQCLGRDQNIRGIKYLDHRPDLVLVTDFEDPMNVQTAEGRRKTLRWFLRELLPACAPGRKVRVHTTPLDPESVPMLLIRDDAWPNKIFPIVYLDEDGVEASSWPERFPLPWIERERLRYRRLGDLEGWNQEYLCRAVSEETRDFRRDMIRMEYQEHRWQGVQCMIDPGRSKGRHNATTGWAAWSWIGNKCVVWDGGAEQMLPDQIVDLAFRLDEQLHPFEIGVEENTLNEWLKQPFRNAMVQRRRVIPFEPKWAPRTQSKHDFIRGLQPFFKDGLIVLAKPMPALTEQLISFPNGAIDGPNALAFCLLNRPGALVYEDFDARDHVRGTVTTSFQRPVFLAVNAKPNVLSAVLLQYGEATLSIIADWLVDGEIPDAIAEVVKEASILTAKAPLVVAGPRHFQSYNNVGVVQAVKGIPAELRPGREPSSGRPWLAQQFALRRRGMAVVEIAEDARWTLAALSGGFAHAQGAGTRNWGEPEDNRYRLLIEGLESFCALLAAGVEDEDEDEDGGQWATDRYGRRYRCAIPNLIHRH
jgi:hypothetical protein